MLELSVIIPAYNVENYIETSILSLFRQEMNENHFEIICIDDGSTDNTANILKQLAISYNNIKIITQKNQGQSIARNIGLKNASGKYIYFLDSDDYLSDNSLKNMLKLADSNNLDMLFFDSTRVNSIDENLPQYYEPNLFTPICSGKDFFSSHNVNNGLCCYLIKKSFIFSHNIRFAEGRYMEDGLFTLSCIDKANRVSFSHSDVHRYYIRENSTTTNRNTKHLKKMSEDNCFVACQINDIIKETHDNQSYSLSLINRRNSYTFFSILSAIRGNFSPKSLNILITTLRENGCYPFERLSKDYGLFLVFTSILFQNYYILLVLCFFSRLFPKAISTIENRFK